MFTFNRSVLVAHTPAQIYALIDDVSSYPQYLPNCSDGGVKSRIARADNSAVQDVEGWLGLSFAGIKQRFTTKNIHTENAKIEMQLLDGPFKTLAGCWQLAPVGEAGCKVTLDMRWEFNSMLLTLTIGAAFSKVAEQLLNSFLAEADRRAALLKAPKQSGAL